MRGDLCDPALGLTTQSKLTVQAPALGSGVPAKSAILGALAAVHIPVHCPVFGVGRLNGSLLFCLPKDVALVSHCVPGLGRGRRVGETIVWGDGTFHVHRLESQVSFAGCNSAYVRSLVCHSASQGQERENQDVQGFKFRTTNHELRASNLPEAWTRKGALLDVLCYSKLRF
jgi:hypothetical protein